MFIFIYGSDTYRSRQKLNEIVEHYKKIHQSGLNLKYLDAKEIDFKDFQDELQQITMFCEKKMAVLKNVFSNQLFKEKLMTNLKELADSQDILLFYETSEIPKNDRFLGLLKKYGKAQEFKPLESQALKNWVKKEIEKHKAKADSRTVEELINLVGNDSWQIINEIHKLISYRKDKNIQMKDVRLLVKPKIEPHIFKTIDAIASKNKKEALLLLKEHAEKGDPPLQLLRMINFQFRNLLLIKNWQLGHKFNQGYGGMPAKELKMHPYVIRKSIAQAGKFSFEELKKIYQKILKADLDIKTGKMEPGTALDLLIAGM